MDRPEESRTLPRRHNHADTVATRLRSIPIVTAMELERGMPASAETEQLVLGAVFTGEDAWYAVSQLELEDFSLEKYRRIFGRMLDLAARGEPIDRVTLTHELMSKGQLESVGGMAEIVDLDQNMPQIVNLEQYVEILREKSRLRKVIFASQSLMERAFMGVESSSALLAAAEESLIGLNGQNGTGGLQDAAQIIEGYEGGFSAFLDTGLRQRGLKSGFVKLDEMTGGLLPGNLVLIAGRPSMGKTALALNMAEFAGAEGKTVAMFSLEMSKEQILTRRMCSAARVDQQRYRQGFLNPEERRRIQATLAELAERPVLVDDTSALSLIDIRSKLKRIQAERGLDLAIVDYLQLMASHGRFESRNQEVSQISRGFKILAGDLAVPIVVLSQLSRGPETRGGDKRPQLSDLRDSGTLEQDADIVLLLYREEYYKPDREDLRGMADLIIAKQRNGPIGSVKLCFLRHFTKFENPASDYEEEPPPEHWGDR